LFYIIRAQCVQIAFVRKIIDDNQWLVVPEKRASSPDDYIALVIRCFISVEHQSTRYPIKPFQYPYAIASCKRGAINHKHTAWHLIFIKHLVAGIYYDLLQHVFIGNQRKMIRSVIPVVKFFTDGLEADKADCQCAGRLRRPE